MRLSVFFLLLLFSCAAGNADRSADDCDTFFDEKNGIGTTDSVMYFLSQSNVNKAVESFNLGQQRARDSGGSSLTTRVSYYKLYRIDEALGKKNINDLSTEILKAHSFPSEETKADCLDQLVEAEHQYLSFYKKRDSIERLNVLNKFRKWILLFPNSRRIQYLYADMNLGAGKVQEARREFTELLDANYYEAPILKKFFFHYLDKTNGADSVKPYIGEFTKRFQGRCNVGYILYQRDYSVNYLENCNRCLASGMFSDSISGGVGLIKFSLGKSDFQAVDSLYKLFRAADRDFVLPDLKVWESGEYFDCIMRSLFLQKKYQELYLFTVKELGHNKKVNVDSNSDFHELIRQYYDEYFKVGSFEKFFDKEFAFVKKDFHA